MGLAIFLQLRETGINEDHPNEDKTTHAELVPRDNKLIYHDLCLPEPQRQTKGVRRLYAGKKGRASGMP